MKNTESKDLIFLSVIIPTYNRAHLITDAIDSVLNQTYTNFEVLVVDDHSTDNTKEVVERYEDERVKYLINIRSKGAQGARNTGLIMAGGDWVAMLDSDDVWAPEKLQVISENIMKNGHYIIGYSSGWQVQNIESGDILSEQKAKHGLVQKKLLLLNNYIGGFSTFIFKREAGLKIGGFDEKFSAKQDHEFYLRLLALGDIYLIERNLVTIRIGNPDRITGNYNKKYRAAIYFGDVFKHELRLCYKCKVRNKTVKFTYGVLDGNSGQIFNLLFYLLVSMFIDYKGFKKYSLLILSVISKSYR